MQPPLTESEITRERLSLEEAVRKVESEAAQRARDVAIGRRITRFTETLNLAFQNDHYTGRVADSLEGEALFDSDMLAQQMSLYLQGKEDAFSDLLFTPVGQLIFDEVSRQYEADSKFKAGVESWISEHDKARDRLKDSRFEIYHYLTTSNVGKLYTFLMLVTERLIRPLPTKSKLESAALEYLSHGEWLQQLKEEQERSARREKGKRQRSQRPETKPELGVIRHKLAEMASPAPSITSDGRLDAGRNLHYDAPAADDELPTLPIRQRALIKSILNGLPRNSPNPSYSPEGA